MHDLPAILAVILSGYALPERGDHGVAHWARVYENGMRIAETVDVDREVVALFAVFHDARRINEGIDDGHGIRGAELALALRGTLIHLEDERFALLADACTRHTDGHCDGDATLRACWDADRLDLGRVGIQPRPQRLCTRAGRDLLAWAHDRAVRGVSPRTVMAAWGLEAPRS